MSHFTDAQQQALDKAYEKLSEQFSGVLIVVLSEIESEAGEETQECVRSYFSGGRTQAIGMAHDALHRLQVNDVDKIEP